MNPSTALAYGLFWLALYYHRECSPCFPPFIFPSFLLLLLLSFSVSPFISRFVFSPRGFPCFLHPLLRVSSFRFLAFHSGGFCSSIISSRCLLANLKYGVFPLRDVFTLTVLLLIYFGFLLCLPFCRFQFWTSIVSSCLFLVCTLCCLLGFGFCCDSFGSRYVF